MSRVARKQATHFFELLLKKSKSPQRGFGETVSLPKKEEALQ